MKSSWFFTRLIKYEEFNLTKTATLGTLPTNTEVFLRGL